MKTRVLVVDDHQAFRDGLKAVINHQTDMEVIEVVWVVWTGNRDL